MTPPQTQQSASQAAQQATAQTTQRATVQATPEEQRPQRIVLVEFPPSGGLFQFSVQLGEGLARAGHQVKVLTGPDPELASRVPGCEVISVLPTWHPTAGADAPEWWRRARRGLRAGQHTAAWVVLLEQLRRLRPDVVLWSAWRFPVDGWGVRAVRRLLPQATLGLIAHEPRPLVEQPGADGLYKTGGLTYDALKPAYHCLDVAFVLGDSAREVLRTTWGLPAPVHVIPHGDEDVFVSETISSVAETAPVALSFGTITGYKGTDDLLAAWPQVLAALPGAQLVIAGAVSADIDETALRAQVAELPGVTLDAGYVALGDVADYLSRARVVVLPYKRSSQSGVAHLAHTFARPVVSTRVGDIPTVVHDEVSGLLVEPGDRTALAAALVRVLSDAALAERLGEGGRAALSTGATWDEVATQVTGALSAVQAHPA